MPTTVSVQVANREKITRTIETGVEVHGAEVADTLTAILFPDGPPAGLTVEGLLRALSGALRTSYQALSAADAQRASESADDVQARAELDLAGTALRDNLIGVRQLFVGVYGDALLPTYRLENATPDGGDTLAQQAQRVIERLQGVALPAPVKPGRGTPDAQALAAALTADLDRFRGAQATVGREQRESQLALTARDRAMEEWNRVYRGVAEATSGLLHLAGRADLAERLRPTARRRQGNPEPADEEALPTNPAA